VEVEEEEEEAALLEGDDEDAKLLSTLHSTATTLFNL
jgi:hypothetical protein